MNMTIGIRRGLRAIKTGVKGLVMRSRTELTWKGIARTLAGSPDGLRLHLGCGDDRMEGMLNCDCRATGGADVVMNCADLRRFEDGTVAVVYSHAFIEHLYRNQQPVFMANAFRVLMDGGWMVALGLPDFKAIAECYLAKEIGITRNRFDVLEAYRYTHGEPEHAPEWWLAQLHKSLFDREYCEKLCAEAGFSSTFVFNYSFPGEDLPVNLGFVAFKGERTVSLIETLAPFRAKFADLERDLGAELMRGGLLQYREERAAAGGAARPAGEFVQRREGARGEAAGR